MSGYKVAVVCPIGPLHKWGYEHTCQGCIGSHAEFADAVYLVQSTSDKAGTASILRRWYNVTLINSPDTWHHRPEDSDEVLNPAYSFSYFHMRNLAIGRTAAWRDGADVVISMSSNIYIPEWSRDGIHAAIGEMLAEDEPEAFLYRSIQLGRQLFVPDKRVPWIANARKWQTAEEAMVYEPDFKPRRFEGVPGEAVVVDCHYWRTMDELHSLYKRFNYMSRMRKTIWTDERLMTEYIAVQAKVGKWDHPLDRWGQELAAKHRSDFVSAIIFDELERRRKAAWAKTTEA